MTASAIKIRPALVSEEKSIREKIAEFQLDPAAFEISQFLVASHDEEIIAVGRIREYGHCSELCTLGVIEKERLKGNASHLVKELVKKAIHQNNLFLVCIIPDFFHPFGFEVVTEYPDCMAEKLRRCETELCVPEKYVVMKKFS